MKDLKAFSVPSVIVVGGPQNRAAAGIWGMDFGQMPFFGQGGS
jgi:hypothetical protein